MKAVELFKDLGYILFEDNDSVLYRKETSMGSSQWVIFSKTENSYSCSHLVGSLSYTSKVSLEMHKAINQQLIELGWI